MLVSGNSLLMRAFIGRPEGQESLGVQTVNYSFVEYRALVARADRYQQK